MIAIAIARIVLVLIVCIIPVTFYFFHKPTVKHYEGDADWRADAKIGLVCTLVCGVSILSLPLVIAIAFPQLENVYQGEPVVERWLFTLIAFLLLGGLFSLFIASVAVKNEKTTKRLTNAFYICGFLTLIIAVGGFLLIRMGIIA